MNSQDNFDKEQQIDINPNNMDNNNYTSNNGINNEENNEGEPGKIKATDFIKKSRNPLVALVTVTLKLLSILSFLFTSIFTSNEALVMTTVILFIAADFWYTKNISGRILVGLRWWNEVKEDGSEEWKFESSHEVKAKSIDTTIFWISLYITPVFWGVFFVLELIGLKLMWTLACLIGFILTGSNTFGYYKCSGEQKKKIQEYINDKTQFGFNKILQYGASALANNNK